MNNIGSRIFELRKQENLTQSALAKIIGVSQKAIDFWEKGVNEPKASYIINLALAFNVSADYLLCIDEYIEKKSLASIEFNKIKAKK